ncbi:MAG: hypothetical protein MJZ22_01660 [Candidatus Saccharibacteria bacterium]|nr:hypothetical protein [Candidatus Saccharibacteria bacterium]
MKKILTLASVSALSLFCGANQASAIGTAGLDVYAEKSSSLYLELDSDNLTFDLNETTLQTQALNVSASTNNATGYTISFNTNNDYNDLRHTSDNNHKIPSITSTTTAENFQNTSWGFSIDAENFNEIPLASQNIFRTAEKGTNEHAMTFGAKSAGDLVAGTYENELIFTALANPVPVMTFEQSYMTDNVGKHHIEEKPDRLGNEAPTGDYYAMQDMTNDICSRVDAYEKMQVVDLRDTKLYWIAKMPDGHCWMTQNLDLDLSTEVTLTPNDTDVSEPWTPTSTTRHGITSDYNDKLYEEGSDLSLSYDPGFNYVKDGYGTTPVSSYIGSDRYEVSDARHLPLNNEQWHYAQGNYYSWGTATTMSYERGKTANAIESYSSYVDALESICPKGWKMPGGAYQYSNGYIPRDDASWFGLVTAVLDPYKLTYIDYTGGNNGKYDDSVQRLSGAPTYLTAAAMSQGNYYFHSYEDGFYHGQDYIADGSNGKYYGYTLNYIGLRGVYWSSTTSSSYEDLERYGGSAHASISTMNIEPSTSYGRRYNTIWWLSSEGVSVRCVAK